MNSIDQTISVYKNSAQLWSALIIDQFIKNGVTSFFPSPGMRNAPLLKAIKNQPKAEIYIGVDERAQSYRALAHTKLTKKPSVLICTSGTALANYLPAIIEARKTHLPIFVLSADRPGELLATDANQTINQIEALRNYTKSFWQASEPQKNFPPRALAGKISFLINDACMEPVGPMHINIPLREPIDETTETIDSGWKEGIELILNSKQPALEFPTIQKDISSKLVDTLLIKLTAAKKPLIIFGPLTSWKQQSESEVKSFIENYGGNFSCDITSSLKFGFGSEDGLIPTLDHPEVLAKLHELKPDFILHFGHRLTSKHYYKFLEKELNSNTELPILQISDGHYHEDPGFSFTERWTIAPAKIIQLLNERIKSSNQLDFKKRPSFNWSQLINKKRSIIEEGPLSYPFISKRAVETLKSAETAFIGNSTFIRSFDSYAAIHSPKNNWSILANRGASGIEGHISMALGMAERSVKPSVAFIGDISFIHDLGTLAKISEVNQSSELKILIVVANNFGGGIFKLLPIAKLENKPDYLDLLTTPHDLKITPIAKAFGIDCETITTKEDYIKALEQWNNSPKLKIIEVLIKDEANTELYDQLRTVKL